MRIPYIMTRIDICAWYRSLLRGWLTKNFWELSLKIDLFHWMIGISSQFNDS